MILKELRQVTSKEALVLIKKGVEILFKGSFEEMPKRLNKEEINCLYPSFTFDHDPYIVVIAK